MSSGFFLRRSLCAPSSKVNSAGPDLAYIPPVVGAQHFLPLVTSQVLVTELQPLLPSMIVKGDYLGN